jgi:hypothetical protein
MRFAVVVLSLFVSGSVCAQHAVQHGPSMGANLDFRHPESGSVSLPFEVVNQHILVPVSVNGSEPFRLILDTGMPAMGAMLYGSERVKSLKLPVEPGMRVAVGGAGGAGTRLEADIVMGQSLSIGELQIGGAQIIVMPPIPGFADYHEGVIGRGLFQNSVVELDFDKKMISFHDPQRFKAPSGVAELPITLRQGMPFTEASVTTLSGTVVPLSLVIDIGASHALSLNTDSNPGITVPDGAVATVIGRGVSGELLGSVGRVKSFTLAGQEFASVVTSFPESGHQNPRGMDSLNGNLGIGLLSRFNLTIDYANQRFLLVPNRSFGKPFEFDMSGLRFGGAGFRIEGLLPDSPAATAGLQTGDVVIEVDGRAAQEIGLWELRDMLRKPGREVALVVERGEAKVAAKLTLRRLV